MEHAANGRPVAAGGEATLRSLVCGTWGRYSRTKVVIPREAGMTEQAVIEAAPVEPAWTEDEQADVANEALVAEELLVEEVSIDGMCGVY
jgi:mycofactocin precursor